MPSIQSFSKSQADHFANAMNHVAFGERSYVSCDRKYSITCTKRKTKRCAFKALLAITSQIQKNELLTTEKKFDLGISLAVLTQRFAKKPRRWYHQIPIISCIYNLSKIRSIHTAVQLTNDLLRGWLVAKNAEHAESVMSSMRPGEIVVWQEGELWKFSQRTPFFPSNPKLVDSFSSYLDLANKTGFEGAKNYYESLKIFHSKAPNESEEAFLQRFSSLEQGRLLMTEGNTASELFLYAKTTTCNRVHWSKKVLSSRDNVHQQVQIFLNALQMQKVSENCFSNIFFPFSQQNAQNPFSHEYFSDFFRTGPNPVQPKPSISQPEPSEILKDKKKQVLSILEPSCNAETVTFEELYKKRKMWLRHNHTDKGGDEQQYKKLVEAWNQFEQAVQKYFKNASLDVEMMQALDKNTCQKKKNC